MKIKCKNCGKRFDAEVYSGLCPRCATYNGAHMQDMEASAASREKGEDAPGAYREEASRQPGSTTGRQVYRKEPEKRTGNGTRILVTAIGILIAVPILTYISFRVWEHNYLKGIVYEGTVFAALDDHPLDFAGEGIDNPIRIKALFTEKWQPSDFPEDKELIGIRVFTECEGYNFSLESEVSLKYGFGGGEFYRTPIDGYYMEEYLEELGLSGQTVLSGYELASPATEEGWFFFVTEKGAEPEELVIFLRSSDSREKVLMEGSLDLTKLGEGVEE